MIPFSKVDCFVVGLDYYLKPMR